MWIPLERRMLDLLRPLHPDLEIQGYKISLANAAKRGQLAKPPARVWATAKPLVGVAGHGQAPCRGGHPRPGRLHGQPATAKAPCKGAAGCYQGQPIRVAARRCNSP
ncbi:hypothetical protein B296_00012947 [Ensete ventricosum]|uniref:Uncharacterized protein n=1 Tax=Ensete ventricosum TaxID=4639 RepID=A0A426XVP1_ENSVE|nr:hypothetical protein B296_00012947 [Ensete ventricosum]